jgi:hypothetical protein
MGLTDYGWFGGSAGYMKERAGYAVGVDIAVGEGYVGRKFLSLLAS